jgi:hypothetical protein
VRHESPSVGKIGEHLAIGSIHTKDGVGFVLPEKRDKEKRKRKNRKREKEKKREKRKNIKERGESESEAASSTRIKGRHVYVSSSCGIIL